MRKRTITKKDKRTQNLEFPEGDCPGRVRDVSADLRIEEVSGGISVSERSRRLLLRYAPLAAILLLASFLLFPNLDDHYLWQDEAETALVGRTILSHGYPIGTDGKNSFSQDIAGDRGKYEAWRLHPWLQFYVAAASIGLLGPNTFAARFPFALFGIAVLIATYFFAEELFGNEKIALLAAGLLATSIPFILLCRQSRYYSLLIFFFLTAAWMYRRFMKLKKHALPSFIIAASLCFHSFYPGFLLLPLGMSFHAAVFHQQRLKPLFKAFALIALVNFPWFLWFRAFPGVRRNIYNPSAIVERLAAFTADIGNFIFSPWLLAVLLILTAIYRLDPDRLGIDLKAWREPAALPILLVIATVVFFSIPAHTFFRYLSPAIPLLCILAALIVYAAFRAHALFGAAVLVFLISTQPLAAYYGEITLKDYTGPMEAASKYLNAHANPGDTVLVTYGDLTLKFYTELRILGGYTGERLEPARNADWVIVRKHNNSPYETPVRRFIAENIDLSKYEKIVLDAPDLAFENRECPRLHRYCTDKNEDNVILYKRRH